MSVLQQRVHIYISTALCIALGEAGMGGVRYSQLYFFVEVPHRFNELATKSEEWNGKPDLECVDGRPPPLKTPVGVLP